MARLVKAATRSSKLAKSDRSRSASADEARTLLERLSAQGVRLFAVDGALRFEAAPGVLTPALREEIRSHKAALLAELTQAPPQSAARPVTVRTGRFDASFAQERLWFLSQLDPDLATYHVPEVLRLSGSLDVEALSRSVTELVRRHEVLRSTLVSVDDRLQQEIHAVAPSYLRVETAEGSALPAQVRAEVERPFDLERGPIFRATLFRASADDHVLVLVIHHVATDGWSTGLLLRELSALYGAFVQGLPSPLAPRALDYADFAVWQRAWLSGDVLAEQLAFWSEHLAGAPAALELPLDRARPPTKQHRGDSVSFELPTSVAEELRAICRREAATPFMVLMAAFQVLLSRWSGQRDVVVGTAIANRNREELETVVGFFVNTLALRGTFDDESTFSSVVRRVKHTALAAYAHQDVPFEKLVEQLGSARDMSRTPVFQAFFVMQNNENAELRLGDVAVTQESIGIAVEKFDLSLALSEQGDTFEGTFSYDAALFDRSTIQRLAEHFRILLGAALRTPDERVFLLPLMTQAEQQRVLVEWNATSHSLGDVTSVHAMFEAQVDRTPDAVAVIFQDTRLTYRALDERANRVARWLLAQGVRVEDRVAVEVERSADMLAAVLGVMKAGAAYVPIDVTLPEDRKQFMKDDASAAIVLDGPTIAEALAMSDDSRPAVRVGAEHLAYVLYTSGSTGRPKGVMVEHASVANLLASLAHEPGIDAGETTLSVTTLSFDVSVAELFFPLVNGAKVVIGSREAARDPQKIADLIAATGARTFGATPATWRMMVDSGWRPTSEMEIHCAGEALPPDLAAALKENGATLWNLYGPTEATVYATGMEVRAGEAITIGRPLRNTQLYIVDDHMQPVPIGVAGELCIAGDGVARGYLGRTALTAEKFAVCPFGNVPGARMYRTGDLARWLPTGEVEYLGRLDFQVKIRGYRIELGEIEALLLAQSSVRAAVVLAREDVPGDKRLVAYLAARESAAMDVEVLRSELGRALPEYMVPSAFMVLDALPLNSNGKVDRKALPAPDLSAVVAAQYVAPRDALERAIAGIFEQVLRVERVGVHDDFFALGGHSLLATQVVSRIRAALDLRLSVRTLFEAPTVAQLAERSRKAAGAGAGEVAPVIERVDRTHPVRASFAQTRLWFLDQLEGPSATYNVPIVTRLDGALDAAVLERAVQALVDRHETLRTTFVAIDGEPYQHIQPSMPVTLTRVQAASEQEVGDAIARVVNAPFDLARGPLLRATLVRSAPSAHVLALCIHHIATDGWSSGVLLREVSALYRSFARGESSPLPAKPVDYADFAEWQRSWLIGDVLAAQLAFWKTHLEGAPAALELPLDRPRPATKQPRGRTVTFELTPATSECIRAMCRREGATPFMVLLAAYQIVLSRWSGQRDVVVGTAIANRTHEQLEQVVGFFVNTLAMRTTLGSTDSFASVVQRVKHTALAAYSHQDAPFEKLVDELDVGRDMSRTPVFQAFFMLQNNERAGLELGDVVASDADAGLAVEKFDVTLALVEEGAIFGGALSYDAALFDHATMQRFVEHFSVLVDAATAAPEERVANLRVMSDAERHRVLVEWNRTARTAPAESSIDALFESQVQRTPDAVAVIFEETHLTYRELDERARRVAQWLLARGTVVGSRVAVSVTRSADMVAAVLGVMKAGAAYIPIDPSYPADRRDFMRSDAAVAAELDDTTLQEALATAARADLTLPRVRRGDLAYVLYTSGSTGKPKGVMIPHGAVVSFLATMSEAPGLAATDTLVSVTTLSFDIAGLELYLPLSVGAKVVVASREAAADPEQLSALIARHAATVVQATPATWRMLLGAGWKPTAAQRIFCGGEALPAEVAEQLTGAGAALWNMYGPTETTIWSTCMKVRAGEPISIGKPIGNTQVYVVDATMSSSPIGVPGELCIAGAGVARGYLARPELTADKFVPDPFSPEPGARMYRTGDRVRWKSDGTLEYLGRIDNQVKVRGFRIELGEIESALLGCEGVRQAVVIVREDTPGDTRIAAYVVPGGPVAPEAEALRTQLKTSLPDYMLPGAFVVLEALPLTPNGKIDRKALPAPDFASSAGASYVAPRSPLEEIIAGAFARVLGLARVGINDNFFEIGGHSLLVMKVVGQVREALRREVPVREVFEAPTVAELARRLASHSGEASAPALVRTDVGSGTVTSYFQDDLLVFERQRPPSGTWTMALRWRLRGPLDRVALQRAIDVLVTRQESLRLVVDLRSPLPVGGLCDLGAFGLRVTEVRGRSDDEIDGACAELAAAAFDRSPLVRFDLLPRGDDDHVLVLTWHVIVQDAEGGERIGRDLFEIYAAIVEGREEPLPPLPVRYVDYAALEKRWYEGERGLAEVAAARVRLVDVPSVALPTDRPRTGHVSTECVTCPFMADEETSKRVFDLCRAASVTPFMGFCVITAVFLARWSGQEEVSFMAPVNHRGLLPEMENVYGRFLNATLITISFEGDPTLAEVFKRTRTATLAAYARASVPLALVLDTPDVFGHPLYRIVLNSPEVGTAAAEQHGAGELVPGLFVTDEQVNVRSGARNEVAIVLAGSENRVYGGVRGATDLFDPATVNAKSQELARVLRSLDLAKRVSEI